MELDHIRRLEISLHTHEVRSDKRQLSALLHESFIEIGRSGKRYCKKDILETLPDGQLITKIWSQDFSINKIAENVILVTYKSAHIVDKGGLENFSHRSSVWVLSGKHWQMRFHQGTSSAEFEAEDA